MQGRNLVMVAGIFAWLQAFSQHACVLDSVSKCCELGLELHGGTAYSWRPVINKDTSQYSFKDLGGERLDSDRKVLGGRMLSKWQICYDGDMPQLADQLTFELVSVTGDVAKNEIIDVSLGSEVK